MSNPGTNGWGDYLTYPSKPGSQVLSACLSPYLLQGMLGIPWPLPYHNSRVQRLGCPSSKSSSIYNPDISVTHRFVPLASWLLHPFPLPPLLIWLKVMNTLNSANYVCLWLCSPFYLQYIFFSTTPRNSNVPSLFIYFFIHLHSRLWLLINHKECHSLLWLLPADIGTSLLGVPKAGMLAKSWKSRLFDSLFRAIWN